jgi:hypothetical protein
MLSTVASIRRYASNIWDTNKSSTTPNNSRDSKNSRDHGDIWNSRNALGSINLGNSRVNNGIKSNRKISQQLPAGKLANKV